MVKNGWGSKTFHIGSSGERVGASSKIMFTTINQWGFAPILGP